MRPFLGFDAGFSIAAEQRDRVSNSEIGVIACIQHNLIHGDRPHLRQWAAPMQSVDPAAESPDHPIGIADRDNGQSAFPRCDVAVAVAHSRPCGDVPDQADPGSDRQGRLQTQFRPEMHGRSLAIERESHSNHVEVKLVTMKGAGRVRQMAAQIPSLVRQRVDDGVEPIVL